MREDPETLTGGSTTSRRDRAAERLSKPELSDHARLYRYDAAHLPHL